MKNLKNLKLLVFTMEKCPNCPAAKKVVKEVAEEIGIEFEEVDVEKNMIKALKYSVASTPSIVLLRDGEHEVLFRSEVPSKRELIDAMGVIIGENRGNS